MKLRNILLILTLSTASHLLPMQQPMSISERVSRAWTILRHYVRSYIYTENQCIWSGMIGTNKVNVMFAISESWFKRYEISRSQACELWAQDRHIFEKLLPLLKKYDEVFVVFGSSGAECYAAIHPYMNHAMISFGNMWPIMTEAEKEFIVAHEVSHLLLGHCPGQSEKDFKSKAEYCGYLKKREQEADLHAAQLLGTAHGGISFFNKLDTRTRQACVTLGGLRVDEVDQLMSAIIRSKAKDQAQHIAVLRTFHDNRVKKHNWSFIKRLYETYKMLRISDHVIQMDHPQYIERVRYLQAWENGQK